MIPDWLQKLMTEGITIPVRLVITPEIDPAFQELFKSSAWNCLSGSVQAGNSCNVNDENISEPIETDLTSKYKPKVDATYLTDKAYWKEIDGKLSIYYMGSKVVTTWNEVEKLSKLDEKSRKIESIKLAGNTSTKQSALSIFLRFYQEGKVKRGAQSTSEEVQAGDEHIPDGVSKKYYPVNGVEGLLYKESNDQIGLLYAGRILSTTWTEVTRLASCKNPVLNNEVHNKFPTDTEKRYALISFVRAYQDERVRDPDALSRPVISVNTRPDENHGKVGEGEIL